MKLPVNRYRKFKIVFVSNVFYDTIYIKVVARKNRSRSRAARIIGMVIGTVSEAVSRSSYYSKVILEAGATVWICPVIPQSQVAIIAHSHYWSPGNFTGS